MATEAEIAWAAGLFEGEGCLTISTNSKTGYQQPRVKLSMTDEDAVVRFHEIVGVGSFREESWFKRQVEGNKMQYQWYTGKRSDVIYVIELLTPWLCGRRLERAQDLLTLCRKG